VIIARSPLRISLGGGGTDLPSYYREHNGFLVAAAINRYVYVTIHQTFVKHMLVRYSKIEQVFHRSEINHPIIREALDLLGIDEPNVEITSMADIPAGTGLGSSASFTTALLKALHKHKKGFVAPRELAEMACHIEMERLKEPTGKQDQYVAAFGGLTAFEFRKDEEVIARPLKVSEETVLQLEDDLVLFSTGVTRAAAAILKEQDVRSRDQDKEMIDNLHYVKEIGYKSCEALEKGDLIRFAQLMNEHWQHKKRRSRLMSTNDIDRWYTIALENGAVGGKLIGAGGGGFLMFFTEQPARLRKAMRQEGLLDLRFHIDFEGTKLLQ
jgi:D-glycero-alpha-D-manno-heptose-7-phosphate kinase